MKASHFSRIALAGLCAAMLSAPAMAQNFALSPSYGSASLSAGFLPDPHRRNGVQAGGDRHYSGGGDCPGGGWFANAPDYRVNYASGSLSLSFYVRARGDTILLINDPAGNWYCNDDFQGLDPAVVFDAPMSGQYDIWVGTYDRSRVTNATIHVSEMGAFSR
ncbi:peptidase S1 [Pararhodobacter sp. SW119]|uniref:peptidase S1 n=1 Tax=Pararhodobacter sp. SW119 TaxID=2780075 RepID=UPI001ADEF7A5|nr:peptidase S1 [Pararhodobacter sp. SW119]